MPQRGGGGLYLASWQDSCSRKVVGWDLRDHDAGGPVSLLVLPFTALLPAYAKDIFHGSATTCGLLDGVIGLGALVGAL